MGGKKLYLLILSVTVGLVALQAWLAGAVSSDLDSLAAMPSLYGVFAYLIEHKRGFSVLTAVLIALVPFVPLYWYTKGKKKEVRRALLRRFIDENLEPLGAEWYRITVHSEAPWYARLRYALFYRVRILARRVPRPKRDVFRIEGTFIRKEIRLGRDSRKASSNSYFFVPYGAPRLCEGIASRAMKGETIERPNLPNISDYVHGQKSGTARTNAGEESRVNTYMDRTFLGDRKQLNRLKHLPTYIFAEGLPDLENQFKGAIVFEAITVGGSLTDTQIEKLKDFARIMGASYTEPNDA